jgi:hypothetical protein
VTLTTAALAVGTPYALHVRGVQDQAPAPNRLVTPGRVVFEVHDTLRPIVELRLNEGRGQMTANTGTSSRTHSSAVITDKQLAWTTNAPPGGAASALDFGVAPADRVVELAGDALPTLRGMKSFTVSGWVNSRRAQVGGGGNRIVTASNNGGDGFDLVITGDGRLQLGVNEWPDDSPARSSAGQVPSDAGAPAANWRFFAVTYDATISSGEVKFYFGDANREATLDGTVAYHRGPLGDDPGPLAVGHFNRRTRAGHLDRMFRGVMDEVRVHGSQVDGAGALTQGQIQALQRNGNVVGNNEPKSP